MTSPKGNAGMTIPVELIERIRLYGENHAEEIKKKFGRSGMYSKQNISYRWILEYILDEIEKK